MGTCEALATQYDTQVLANLPIEPAIREGGDTGKPVVYFAPESISAKRYMIAADKLIAFLDGVDDNISNSAIQPSMPAGVSACSTEGQKIKAEQEKAKSSGESCGTGCGCH
jgi:ATP-binding protein involved in chromosome partitioning